MRFFLFDLDGTLVDSERQNTEAVARVLERLGIHLTPDEREFVIGHGWGEIHAHLAAAEKCPLPLAGLIAATVEEKHAMVGERGFPEVPGAREFVRRAAAHGRCAVVSGSSRREIDEALRHLGLDGLLPWFVAAEDVAQGKPSPEGYLRALAHLGARPSEAVVFEDSTAGIRAARAAGIFCVALGAANFAGQDQSEADLCVGSFADLDDRFFAG